ncbi:hypothetical protein CAEBREN_18722 [Caenorhabditis brenneri]|uniref:BED-type domain-containing protein n=1 Tax=Caenorhabditis brenneri TaxID=135651 RepID=G0MW38_CAEBE|nr:hypothetical protein CAEBREN_18722 [Caenorhabditis brenneri]
MNHKQSESDKKLSKLLEGGEKAILGEEFKVDSIRLVLLKDGDDEYKPSGRAVCTLCKSFLAGKDGGHISRHVYVTCPKIKASVEPPANSLDDEQEEPPMKQRKLIEFSTRLFSRNQVGKLTSALAQHALTTGKSFNYVAGDSMKTLMIQVANATGNGRYGSEAKKQFPCRQTVQKHSMILAEKLIKKAFEKIKPYAGSRVNIIVDHGKLFDNYLSIFASVIDNNFDLKLVPIGFTPSNEGKTGTDTANSIIERLQDYGWTEEDARSCSVTADGALTTLKSHFRSYVRCVSHSIHLLAEKVVVPLEVHSKKMNPELLAVLSEASNCLLNAQSLASAIRNNFQVCSELSKLPTLPSDTRWLNSLKCLQDVTSLSTEIHNIVSQLSAKGRNSAYWLSENQKIVKSVLLVLSPFLKYSELFQVLEKKMDTLCWFGFLGYQR